MSKSLFLILTRFFMSSLTTHAEATISLDTFSCKTESALNSVTYQISFAVLNLWDKERIALFRLEDSKNDFLLIEPSDQSSVQVLNENTQVSVHQRRGASFFSVAGGNQNYFGEIAFPRFAIRPVSGIFYGTLMVRDMRYRELSFYSKLECEHSVR